MLGFVLPQRDVAWRLNWYNELRMPMLAAALLADEGRVNLERKIGEMISFVQGNPTSIMEIDASEGKAANIDELMYDEQMLSRVLNSMKLH